MEVGNIDGMIAADTRLSDADLSGVKGAMDIVIKALKEDTGYFYSWQANIAVAFQDEFFRRNTPMTREEIHEISNKAAKDFLILLTR